MTQRVFTANGPGRVVQSETVRGRESFLVEGDGFSRWFFANELSWDETPQRVNPKNHTTLPYNFNPQTPEHSGISTILPGEHTIDRSERLRATDSVSGDAASDERTPGPNPDLFADVKMGEDEYQTDTILPGEQSLYPSTKVHSASAVGADPANGAWVVIAEDFGDRFQTNSLVLAQKAAAMPEAFSPGYREARVAGMDNPFAEAESLLRTSATVREAAWADVREKALRLRREGAVHVVDEDTKSIMANVQGDHGLYDTFVIRQAHFAGNSSVSEWSCSCEWGYWAFKRKRSFVGRMCSHAYAAYLELQSMNHRQKRGRGRTSSVGPDYEPMGKYVDEKLDMPSELRMEPEGFVPQFNYVDRADREIRRDKMAMRLQASDESLLDDLRALSEETHRPQGEAERREELAEVVEELRSRGYDADQLVASVRRKADGTKWTDQLVHEPFAGSGPSDHHRAVTSEDTVDDWYDDPRLESQDLADDGYEPDTSPGGTSDSELERQRMNKSSAYDDGEDDEHTEPTPAADDGDGDEDPDYVVAQFQRSAAAASLMSDSSGGNDDIAGAAQAFLRTAGRHYTFAEQQELIDEGRPGAASNLSDLKLDGTHYLA